MHVGGGSRRSTGFLYLHRNLPRWLHRLVLNAREDNLMCDMLCRSTSVASSLLHSHTAHVLRAASCNRCSAGSCIPCNMKLGRSVHAGKHCRFFSAGTDRTCGGLAPGPGIGFARKNTCAILKTIITPRYTWQSSLKGGPIRYKYQQMAICIHIYNIQQKWMCASRMPVPCLFLDHFLF